jgi:hypothetical protein
MSRLTNDDVLGLLREAAPESVEPIRTDLWPLVRRRIEASPRTLGRIDWVLITVVTVLCLLRPALVGVLLFHF